MGAGRGASRLGKRCGVLRGSGVTWWVVKLRRRSNTVAR